MTLKSGSSWSNKGCVVHYGLAIHIKKNLKAKEELWKFKYFTIAKILKISSKTIL
jgi:hypothetical protein